MMLKCFHVERFVLDTIYKRFIFALATPFSCPVMPDSGSKVGSSVTTKALRVSGGVLASARVLNLTTKCYLKVRQAEGRIENCVSEWVVQGKSIRDLNLAQIVQRRSQAARQQEGMFYWVEVISKDGKAKMVKKPIYAELPGLIFKPAPNAQASTRQSFALLKQANQFCQAHA